MGYNAQTIPIGAEVALTDPAATIVRIDGFGAAQNVVQQFTGGAPTCQVTVDAAPGRSIRVQAQSQKVHPRVRSDEEMCRLAADAASMVMTTVVATTG